MPQFYVAARARVDRMKSLAKARMDKVKSFPCCRVFINSIMALLSRCLYIGHAMLTVWRVAEVLGLWYWTVSLWLVSLLIETCIVVFVRGGKEWKWFQPCILIYLMVEVPSICMLELEKASQVQLENNATEVILGDLLTKKIRTTGVKIKIGINEDWWALLLNQSMMILLIIARWLMPKGDLTRDQLSALLLYYLGTASDIVDFFSVLSEGDDLLLNKVFIYTILVAWAWSMFQFVFVVTMTAAGNDEAAGDEEKNKLFEQVEKGKFNKSTEKLLDPDAHLTWWQRLKKRITFILASEAWAIGISMAMQDGPFAVIRLVCLFYWKIRTYTNYFFTFKNVLVLCLQIYRLVAVYEEFKKSKEEEKEKRQAELREHLTKAKFKAGAVSALSGSFGKKKRLQREDTLEEFSDEDDDDETVTVTTETESSIEVVTTKRRSDDDDDDDDDDDETDYDISDTESDVTPKVSC